MLHLSCRFALALMLQICSNIFSCLEEKITGATGTKGARNGKYKEAGFVPMGSQDKKKRTPCHLQNL
jgi:hypothetical protein